MNKVEKLKLVRLTPPERVNQSVLSGSVALTASGLHTSQELTESCDSAVVTQLLH